MPLITKGKTNLKYILIVIILAAIVGGGILVYWWIIRQEAPPEIIPTLIKCPLWYKSIEKTFEEANFCEKDIDCKAITLGGPYVEFGCYKFVNITTNEKEILERVEKYDKACAPAINECAPAPNTVCVSNKCLPAQKGNVLLFEKREGWGPCPPNATCAQSTRLYYSGKLILEGAKNIEKQLDANTIEKIVSEIKSSGIMNKDCSASIVLDYGAEYTLTLDEQTKIIDFPGCEDELREIEKLINL